MNRDNNSKSTGSIRNLLASKATGKFKFILFITLISVLFTGCYTYLEPRADFEASKTVVYTKEEIKFFNYSSSATDFEWDFGDGFITDFDAPVHYYDRPGVYTVKLAAFHGDHADYAYLTIEVVERPAATLDIQVLEYYSGYAIAGASIIIYPTYNDWLNQTNGITEVSTNSQGIAVVSGLAPGYYYLDIWEKNHNNYSLAGEDVGFIKTPFCINYKTTYFTAYVDYTGTAKSAGATRRGNILKNTTKRVYSESLNVRK